MTGRWPNLLEGPARRRRSVVLAAATLGPLLSLTASCGSVSGAQTEPAVRHTASAPSRTGPSDDGATAAVPREVGRPADIAPMPRSRPVRLEIPAIDVDSTLMELGLAADGSLETPPSAFPAGWFSGAPTPGEVGPAIIVGHVRYRTPGVFARLAELRPSDEILVERADGRTALFSVTEVLRFDKSAFPSDQVYGDLEHPGLRLITCAGYDATTNAFEENVVVFGELVAP